jgi:transposase InsO family protein
VRINQSFPDRIQTDAARRRSSAYEPLADVPDALGLKSAFWRTLVEDVIEGATFDNLHHFANELFEYILYYNNLRPHQALAGQTPKAFAATKTTAIQSAN